MSSANEAPAAEQVPAGVPPAEAARRRQGHVALVFVQIFFGLFPFFAKWALVAFDPRVIVGWRITLGSLVLGTIAVFWHGVRASVPLRELFPTRSELPRVVLCSLLGVVINQALFVEGMHRTTTVDAGVPCTPAYTALTGRTPSRRQTRQRRYRGQGGIRARRYPGGRRERAAAQ